MNEKEDPLSSDASCVNCPDCGLLQRLPVTTRPADVYCVRCYRKLRRYGPELSQSVTCACAAVALALLLAAYALPMMSVRSSDRYTEATLASGPKLLFQTRQWALGIALFVTLFLTPVSEILLVVVTALGNIHAKIPHSWREFPIRLLPVVSRWSMLEIFLLGVLVSWTRLSQWLTVTAAPALVALFGAVGVMFVVNRALTSKRLISQAPSLTTADASRLYLRQSNSPSGIARCAAFTLAGYLLYIPANLFPIMTARRLLEGGPMTILGGVRELIRDGSWVLATVVFLASIAVPLLKLVVLSVLLVMTAFGSQRGLRARAWLFRAIEVIGRWSMLDIFVLSLLVGLVRLGALGYVRPEPGALAFCAVVVVTMLATEVFDPKSMWDAAGQNERAGSRFHVGGTP